MSELMNFIIIIRFLKEKELIEKFNNHFIIYRNTFINRNAVYV